MTESPGVAWVASSGSYSLTAENSHPLFARLYFRRSALLFFFFSDSITIKAMN